MVVVTPVEKKMTSCCNIYFFFSRIVYIFAWKLVGGEMQLAIVYFVTIVL